MRLVVFLRYFPTLTETFVVRELAALHARGVSIAIVALGSRVDGEYACLPFLIGDSEGAIPVFRPNGLPFITWIYEGGPSLPGQARWRQNWRLASVISWVRQWRADRIHAHFAGEASEWACTVAKQLDIPWSVTVHGVDLWKPRPRLKSLLESAAQVVTVSESQRQWMEQQYQIQATVIYCGVPLDVPQADPKQQPPLWLSIARHVPKKGLDFWSQLVQENTALESQFASDMPSQDRISSKMISNDKIPQFLASGQIFVLPCRIAPDGDRDGLPVAILEAMAAGLPIVSTPIAGIPEIIDEQVGWLLPPDDFSAWSKCLREIYADPEQRHQRGKAARQRIVERQLTPARQAAELMALWTKS